MEISINTRQAYCEVDEFLNIISVESKNKVPEYLREFFNKEKDETYIKRIIPSIPIKEQSLKEETLAIIAWLNLEYWCQDEDEKKRLKEVYENNEKKYNELVQVEFSPNEVFKQKEHTTTSNIPIVKNKESNIKRLVSRLKSIIESIFQ